MPWRNVKSVPFTRIAIAAHVPSESGIYAVFHQEDCAVVGQAWNLKGRLLELLNALPSSDGLSVSFELCPECESAARRREMEAELLCIDDLPERRLPGISLRGLPSRQSA